MNISKVLTIIFLVLVLASVGFAYYRYMVQKDFLVKYQTPCDPSMEACFVYECDPELEECAGNPEEDTAYYSLMYRKAFNVPECDIEIEGDCDAAYVCPKTEEGCEMITCTEETTLTEEVACSDPKDFPIEEVEEIVEEEVMEEPILTPEPQTLEVPAVVPQVEPVAPTIPSTTPATTTSPQTPAARPVAL